MAQDPGSARDIVQIPGVIFRWQRAAVAVPKKPTERRSTYRCIGNVGVNQRCNPSPDLPGRNRVARHRRARAAAAPARHRSSARNPRRRSPRWRNRSCSPVTGSGAGTRTRPPRRLDAIARSSAAVTTYLSDNFVNYLSRQIVSRWSLPAATRLAGSDPGLAQTRAAAWTLPDWGTGQ